MIDVPSQPADDLARELGHHREIQERRLGELEELIARLARQLTNQGASPELLRLYAAWMNSLALERTLLAAKSRLDDAAVRWKRNNPSP